MPSLGETFSFFGGIGNDTLTVDAQAGLPSDDGVSQVTVNPGGATVNYSSFETIDLLCGSCALAASNAFAPLSVSIPNDVGLHTSSHDLNLGFDAFVKRATRAIQAARASAADRIFATNEVAESEVGLDIVEDQQQLNDPLDISPLDDTIDDLLNS